MERQSEILTTTIDLDGSTYSAAYFVEGNFLCANIGGRIIRGTLGSRSAEETVKSLLQGFAQTGKHRQSLLQTWRRTEIVGPSMQGDHR